MRSLIIYHTKYGTTQRIASSIAERLTGESALIPVRKADGTMIEDADLVVIGAAVYGGKISSLVTRFLDRHQALLMSKRIGLYVSCFYRDERAEEQIRDSFPATLIKHATASDWLGGAVRLSTLKFADRLLISRIGRLQSDVDRVETGRIDAFSESLNSGA